MKKNMTRVTSLFIQRSVFAIPRYCLSTEATAKKEDVTSNFNDVKPFNEMPGPRPVLPLIGTVLSRKRDKDFLKDINDMVRQYGPVFREKIGPQWAVFINDPADICKMYRNEGKYPYRGDVVPLEKIYCKRENRTISLGVLDGEEWYDSRRRVSYHLLKKNATLPFLHDQEEVAEDFVEHIRKIKNNEGIVKNLTFELYKYSLEAAMTLTFNIRLNCLGLSSDSDCESALFMNSIITGLASIEKSFSSVFKLFKYLPTPLYKEYKDASNISRKMRNQLYEEALKRLEASKTDPSVKIPLLINYLVNTAGLDEQSIQQILHGLVQAAVDTTGTMLAWMLYSLARNPEKQGNLAEEIDCVLPHGAKVDGNTIENMPYLTASVKESFRLNYPLAMGVPRILPKEIVLGGYIVPKGIMIIPLNRQLCRSEKHFRDADMFLPERWLRDNVTGKRETEIDPFILLPFGHGTRTCLGKRVALQEIYLLTVKLFQNFRVEYSGEDMKPVMGTFVQMDKPLNLAFIDR